MGTLQTRRLTTDSILRINETDDEAIASFKKKLMRRQGVEITYEEHPSPRACFLHLRSPGMIPGDVLDCMCQSECVQMWAYYVLH